jgi:anti-sigma B factor antagonist
VKFRTVYNGRIAIIDLKGAIIGDDDTDNFRDVVADFIEQGNKCLVVNLERVNYMNSSGVGSLIAAHTSYARNGGEVRLAGVGKSIKNLLTITRLIDVFDVFDTVNEAIDSFVASKAIS